MKQTECVAMLLAGGEGKRLGVLTSQLAKPAVPFGGKYRIIDFTLSNCTNSGISSVGILTQYQPELLHAHIGTGSAWKLDQPGGDATLLSSDECKVYKGTADAIYQNFAYLEERDPEYVLIISGDHIYNMDYRQMLEYHKAKKADATISVIPVKWEEASRFGIMNTDKLGRVTDFVEKPAKPQSNLASMGIYIFNWEILREFLLKDAANASSSNDFGKDIIPLLLQEGAKLHAYSFKGYWKDVGTVQSLWDAHMDLLEAEPVMILNGEEWPLYTNCEPSASQYISPTARIASSSINEGCRIYGEVDHSVIFCNVEVGEGSLIRDSIIMPGAVIGKNVIIHKAIVGEGTVIRDGAIVGDFEEDEIIVIGDHEVVTKEADRLPKIFAPRNSIFLERIG
ncbi:glucose-1-phosphate adenylyltransferase [Gorillibacterium timonense]|uniref:glucose-1-phosphate adenylyltransferase n=1 Tax=Gorillibacterium timonense TaxID=1689269 RepID=UPI00071D5AD0|nr:glucose-1-phosphate adenylyltransferase [Gorillibacterium timonense]